MAGRAAAQPVSCPQTVEAAYLTRPVPSRRGWCGDRLGYDAPSVGDRKTETGVVGSNAEAGFLEELRRLLQDADRDHGALDRGLVELAEAHGDDVYRSLFHRAAHLWFEADEARQHWRELVGHWRGLDTKLGTPQDLRVALVSYFIDVARRFENPTVIEMQMLEEARDLAYRDGLTGLFNYRYFRESLALEISRSERYGAPLSLVMVDVDDFKAFNDEHGHEAGNRALCDIGAALSESVRPVDVAVRYGGEEFTLLLSSTPKVGAQLTAERVRARIEEIFAERGALTASFGVATYPADAVVGDRLVRCADRALYLAKATGKNRVALYGESSRSFQRIEARIEGAFRMVAGPPLALVTVNLSESGLRVETEHAIPKDTLIEVVLDLEDGALQIPTQVVDRYSQAGSLEVVTLRILALDTASRHRLRGLVRDAAADEAQES